MRLPTLKVVAEVFARDISLWSVVDITLANGCFDIVVDVIVVFERLMGFKIFLRVPNSLQKYHVREDD